VRSLRGLESDYTVSETAHSVDDGLDVRDGDAETNWRRGLRGRIEFENEPAKIGRIMVGARTVLLRSESEAEGFIELARAPYQARKPRASARGSMGS
jgi:hypothetical protein